MSKPIIGIVTKHSRRESLRLETFIRDEVEQAIFDNGGIAIGVLPPNEDKILAKSNWKENLTTEEKHNLYAELSLCDGVILQGGGYVDEYECFIAKYCSDYDIPILGICAGKHVLVLAQDGEIGKIGNDNHEKEDDYVHSIKIAEDSLAYKILEKKELMVNSRHMRCSKNTGNTVITATSPDGIDEIIEYPTNTFYLGVQFHPESLYKKDENMKKIFTYFISVCESNKKNK